jgi:hypothetical protein
MEIWQRRGLQGAQVDADKEMRLPNGDDALPRGQILMSEDELALRAQ